MQSTVFYKQLFIISLITALIIQLLHAQFPILGDYLFSFISIVFFTVFCVLVYRLHLMATKSTDKSLFSRIFLVSIFLKLMFCILLVVGNLLLAKPDNYYFVLPFFLVYIIYTIFEVNFIIKLAKA